MFYSFKYYLHPWNTLKNITFSVKVLDTFEYSFFFFLKHPWVLFPTQCDSANIVRENNNVTTCLKNIRLSDVYSIRQRSWGRLATKLSWAGATEPSKTIVKWTEYCFSQTTRFWPFYVRLRTTIDHVWERPQKTCVLTQTPAASIVMLEI